jgi:hypothetical protein
MARPWRQKWRRMSGAGKAARRDGIGLKIDDIASSRLPSLLPCLPRAPIASSWSQMRWNQDVSGSLAVRCTGSTRKDDIRASDTATAGAQCVAICTVMTECLSCTPSTYARLTIPIDHGSDRIQ